MEQEKPQVVYKKEDVDNAMSALISASERHTEAICNISKEYVNKAYKDSHRYAIALFAIYLVFTAIGIVVFLTSQT